MPVPLANGTPQGLAEVPSRLKLAPGTWCREKDATLLCLEMSKGAATVSFTA